MTGPMAKPTPPPAITTTTTVGVEASALPKRRLPQHLPWILLLAALASTLAGWKLWEEVVRVRAQDRFEAVVAQIVGNITSRLHTYEQILRGGVGLFAASGASSGASSGFVSRKQWHDYTEKLQISQNFPGIQGIGFAVPIVQNQLEEHLQTIRAEGFPEYTIWPDGKREFYSAIIYLEPFQDRNLRAFGYDMLSEPVRRTAMLSARDTGNTSLSGRVTLVQETHIDVQAGFLMYLPVYKTGAELISGQALNSVAARQTAHIGWVYAPFRSRDFIHGILGNHTDMINLTLFDGPTANANTLLFSSNPDDRPSRDRPDTFSANHLIEIYGRTWLVQITARDSFYGISDHHQPVLVLIFGVAISLLVFFLTRSLCQTEQRAVEIAAQMTVTLADKQADLERSNQEMERFTEVLAHHLQEPVRHQYAFAQRLDRLIPKPLPDDAQKSLDYILKGAIRLRLLLRDVQLYLSLGRQVRTPTPSSATSACAAACDDLADKITACGAHIACTPLPDVWIDANRLRDVFYALLDNALEYRHPERPLQVSVQGHVMNDVATLSIADNGSGIPLQYRTRVFQVFERFHPSNSHGGTGIGLSIAQKIIESAHGHIWIESGTEHGIIVYFTLQAAQTPDSPTI